MHIINNDITSAEGSTNVYSTQEYACTKKDCGNYAGTDLNKPFKSVKGTPTKIN